MRSVNVDVEYNEKYTFEVQVETDVEKSDWTSKSWTSHSGMQWCKNGSKL